MKRRIIDRDWSREARLINKYVKEKAKEIGVPVEKLDVEFWPETDGYTYEIFLIED